MNVKQASTELYTLEEGDIFRIAPVSEEEVRQLFAIHGEVPTDEELQTYTESEYDGLREDVWYRFLRGPDDVGCYSFESVNDVRDYHEQPGGLLVQKLGDKMNAKLTNITLIHKGVTYRHVGSSIHQAFWDGYDNVKYHQHVLLPVWREGRAAAKQGLYRDVQVLPTRYRK